MKDKANKKAKPVYAVASYLAHRLPDEGGFAVTLTSVTKDGVELLADDERARAETVFATRSTEGAVALSDVEIALFGEEEAVEFEDAKLAALDLLRAERKEAKRAAQAAHAAELLAKGEQAGGVAGTPDTAPDPLREARLTAFRALAEDLGIKVNKDATKAFEPAVKDAKKAAARFALRQAATAFSLKTGEPVGAEAMAKLQLAHDALACICDGATCASVAPSVEPGTLTATQPAAPAATATVDTEALAKALDLSKLATAIDGVQQVLLGDTTSATTKMAEIHAEVEKLKTTIKELGQMPLGRPTQANAKVVVDAGSATWADLAAAGKTATEQGKIASAEDLLAGTEIVYVQRGYGQMKMRKWPAGHGAGARPPILDAVKPFMLMSDLIAYNDGGEALVPDLTD